MDPEVPGSSPEWVSLFYEARSYPSLHPFGVIHWVSEQLNIKNLGANVLFFLLSSLSVLTFLLKDRIYGKCQIFRWLEFQILGAQWLNVYWLCSLTEQSMGFGDNDENLLSNALIDQWLIIMVSAALIIVSMPIFHCMIINLGLFVQHFWGAASLLGGCFPVGGSTLSTENQPLVSLPFVGLIVISHDREIVCWWKFGAMIILVKKHALADATHPPPSWLMPPTLWERVVLMNVHPFLLP